MSYARGCGGSGRGRLGPSRLVGLVSGGRRMRLGSLVVCEGDQRGVARIINVDDIDQIVIQYFQSPAAEDRPEQVVHWSRLQPAKLSENTRVYCQDTESGIWHVGRLAGGELIPAAALGTDFDGYRVALPNKRVVNVPEDDLWVRSNDPVSDPMDYLVARVHETPFWHRGRSDLVRAIINQRRAAGGLTALISSSVELFRHQYEVLRRVFNDPIQRYLLADEVGLGKTIEAAVIVRQYVLDCQGDPRVVILVPAHLVAQWKSELTRRVHLGHMLGDGIEVLPTNDSGLARLAQGAIDLLVIDEVHQIAGWTLTERAADQVRWDVVAAAARRSPRLLLLSATPVLKNERGFLAMLHLLDPSVYSLDDWSAFQIRVRNRERIANAYHGIRPGAADMVLEDQADALLKCLPDDERLQRLGQRVLEVAGEDLAENDERRLSAVSALRLHVSETYRLHRRMLRSRRHAVDDPLHGRAGAQTVAVPDGGDIGALLEEWRDGASEHIYGRDDDGVRRAFATVYGLLLESAHAHPSELARVVQARAARRSDDTSLRYHPNAARASVDLEMFPDEPNILARLLDTALQTASADAKTQALKCWLASNDAPVCVVFAGSADLALLIHTHIDRIDVALYPEGLALFYSGKAKVLVCGPEAEDGLNLQHTSTCVVHYDLPMSANRIEQRIGRLDRLKGSGKVSSIVLCPESGPARLWYDCLNEGAQIFTTSSASLQYVLEEDLHRIQLDLLTKGESALQGLLQNWRDSKKGLAAIRRRIQRQEVLDSLEDDQDARAIYADFEDGEYEEDEKGNAPLAREVGTVLGRSFGLKREDIQLPSYQYSFGGNVLSFGDFSRWFGQATFPFSSKLMRPFTFCRSTAEKRAIAIARVGHPLVDGLWDFTQHDDRGIAFAMLRLRPKIDLAGIPDLAFRFDYFVEADLRPALRALDTYENATPQAVQRRADLAFAPRYETIWVDRDLNPLDDKRVLAHLEAPYRDRALAHAGTDANIQPSDWAVLDDELGIGDWPALCRGASRAARTHFEAHIDLDGTCAKSTERLYQAHQTLAAQLESRLANMPAGTGSDERETLALERDLYIALTEGLSAPRIRLDAVGAVVTLRTNPNDGTDK